MTNKKRDLELLSKILFAIEDSNADEITTPQSLNAHELIQNYDENVVFLHVRLLDNVKFIDVTLKDNLEDKNYLIQGITWDGYDYLEKARKKLEIRGRI